MLGGWTRFARLTPDEPAVLDGAQTLTYEELDRRVDRLARRVASVLPQGDGRRAPLVAVCVGRGAGVVVALLAVHRAGAAFTVVERTTRPRRDRRLLTAIAPDLVVVDDLDAGVPSGVPSIALDGSAPSSPAPLPTVAPSEDLAYVVFTSGSSGTPKGVEVTCANVDHYARAVMRRLSVDAPLRYSHVTTFAADLGYTSLFLALASGGSIDVVPDLTRRDPAALMGHLRAVRSDVVKTTPSHWHLVSAALADEDRGLLRVLVLGGERLTPEVAAAALSSGVATTLVNHYGPSETTVGVCTQEVTPSVVGAARSAGGSIPVGRPLPGLQAWVDDGGRARPVRSDVGRPLRGELLVSGPQVARGYRDDPARTDGSFGLVAPDGPRAYRTGDVVRVGAEGAVEFLGREDRQVKIAGHRVELADVEDRLTRVPGVQQAHGFTLEAGRARLHAAVTVVPGGPDEATVREVMRREHADHLVPERVVVLDALPLTENGKVDAEALRGLVASRAPSPAPASPVSDPLLLVRGAWATALGHDRFEDHDDFSAVGGTSIASIHVVAIVQEAGHRLRTADVFERTTIASQVEMLRQTARSDATPRPRDAGTPEDPTALTPAQRAFFRRDLAEPDHWNQAFVMEVDHDVDVVALRAAVRDVADAHDQLRSAYTRTDGVVRRTVVDTSAELTTSDLPADGDVAAHARAVGARLQQRISVLDGRLLAVHLVRSPDRAWLLVVAHHLAVDAVSWRLLLTLLGQRYGRRVSDADPEPVTAVRGLGRWATALEADRDLLRPDLDHWQDVQGDEPQRESSLEGRSRTQWFSLTVAETTALEQAAVALGVGLQDVVASAAVRALRAAGLSPERAVLDVESHGRDLGSDDANALSLVSWFTATFPVVVDAGQGLAALSRELGAAVCAVPHGGVAHDLFELPRRAPLCVNHLGPVVLPVGSLSARPSDLSLGPLRGPRNLRSHRWTLTSRVSDGALVLDLGTSLDDPARAAVESLPGRVLADLLELAGRPPRPVEVVLEDESSGGQLGRVPAGLGATRAGAVGPARSPSRTSHVVLTGATGFIGAHVLADLLATTRHRVTCIVRPSPPTSARERLCSAVSDTLGALPEGMRTRVDVVEGDVTVERLGLDPATWDRLAATTSAIYHLAADTRLAGPEEVMQAQNVRSIDTICELAGTGGGTTIHYASTLAVAGRSARSGVRTFTEDSLDVGQLFMNHYERSKYDAEKRLARHAAAGGSVCIYRTGNVWAHSVTGAFRRDADDSRVVQLVRGCLVLGQVPALPDDSIVLAPVDVVSRGLVAIAEGPGARRGGTHHVDSPHAVPWQSIFAAMRDAGASLQGVPARSFSELFSSVSAASSPELALARWWAERPDRGVLVDSTRTIERLAELGVRFPAPSATWLAHLGRLFVGSASSSPWVREDREVVQVR